MPFAELLGITVTDATPERAVATLAYRPEICTAGGIVHGGALMTLADSTGALCAFLGLPEGATTATTSSHTVLLRAARGGTLTATARVVHRGRRDVVVDTEVTDDGGRPVSRTTQTQAVLGP
ncbi:PaaI family thioesterase [Pseudonocardia sp. C8]|nr:PaaI family thioesterase [Pseudonocardia sp. C8]MBC3194467.1 PaaI family thioesterase [Pseudonocardia sp. C8]